ncbi:hypothetical protein N658DRAFT_499676 [Parathielavia hyrcaniae]|uniref:Uncharacterized protein n=1 Tax=Parathielavia hyrcaniae TaxID=113614 RepID=A0AAN6PWB3_9PEZI|nr:hypothetical protein N658DRAFT_499676 [Parathielavia hyrcaniae]
MSFHFLVVVLISRRKSQELTFPVVNSQCRISLTSLDYDYLLLTLPHMTWTREVGGVNLPTNGKRAEQRWLWTQDHEPETQVQPLLT